MFLNQFERGTNHNLCTADPGPCVQDVPLITQKSTKDLGERLYAAVAQVLSHMGSRVRFPTNTVKLRCMHVTSRFYKARILLRAFMQVIVVGTDVPDLTAEVISCANGELDGHDISMGPSEDGGYYLIAMKQPHKALFQNVQWSTPSVHETTQAAANAVGLSFALETSLPRLRDIDFVEVCTLSLAWVLTALVSVCTLCSQNTPTSQCAGLGRMGTRTSGDNKGEALDVEECGICCYKD
jgi:Uncharacterized protein conserved in bacteria (DUF2064)